MMNSLFQLLALLLIIALANNDGANAQFNSGNKVEGGGDDQVLYANPQFYTLSDDAGSDALQAQAESVMGLLFNMRSKHETDTIYITGFEFFTTLTDSVYYELRSREGVYWDDVSGRDGGPGIGEWESFDLISSGMADGSGECREMMMESFRNREGDERVLGSNNGMHPADGVRQLQSDPPTCPLTAVPRKDFTATHALSNDVLYPWTLKAKETRSFYITLPSQNLLALPRSTSDPIDSVIAASTPDLDLYEGVAPLTYPLHPTENEFYLDEPVGFIGKVLYRVEAPITDSPTETPGDATLSPTTSLAPTVFGATKPPTDPPASLTDIPTYAPTRVPETLKPSPKPTRRCRPGRPCLNPPAPGSQVPTPSPLVSSPVPQTVEMMVYMETVPERVMSEREEEEYVDAMLEHLKGNEDLRKAGIKPNQVKVFYTNVLDEEQMRQEKGCRGKGWGPGASEENTRNATEDGFTYTYDEDSCYIPKAFPAIYVMTEMEVLSKLPFDVTAFYLWDELTDHEMELMESFKARSLFVSYFRELTNVTYEVVDDFTKPPTPSPTITPDGLEEMEEEEAQAAAERRNLLTAVGIGIGILWLLLTCCGVRQILKHRKVAREQEELRRSQRISRAQSIKSMNKRRQSSATKRLSVMDWSFGHKRKNSSHVESALPAVAEEEEGNSNVSTASPTALLASRRSGPSVSFADEPPRASASSSSNDDAGAFA